MQLIIKLNMKDYRKKLASIRDKIACRVQAMRGETSVIKGDTVYVLRPDVYVRYRGRAPLNCRKNG